MMRNWYFLIFCGALALFVSLWTSPPRPAWAQSANLLSNGGFESPALNASPPPQFGPNASVDLPTWVYPDDTSRGSAEVGSWYYRGGSGIINAEPGYNEWYGNVSPTGFSGQQYAFLQLTGVFAKPFNITSSGTYQLQWLEGGRPTSQEVGIDPGLYDGNQTYRVIIDRVVVGKFKTVSDQNFTAESLQVDLASGSHILYFQGLTNTGDHTAFIDNVSLAPAP